MSVVLAVVAAVVLASPFGVADGTAVDDTDGLIITTTVEVTGSYEVVLVRPFSSFEELAPTALLDQGDGTWGGTVRLPSAENWSLVFDAIEPDGQSDRSETVTLTDLGIDPVVVAGEPSAPVDSGPVPSTTWWLIVGVVLAFAALGVLAWWTFSDDDADAADDDVPPSGAGAAGGNA